MKTIEVGLKLLNDKAVVPTYGTQGAAGFDFYSTTEITVEAGETVLIKTGLAMEIPEGYELQVRPRSGMSLKTKVRVANSPGTIDCDYRGEVGIIIDNIGTTPYEVKIGDRIAQGVLNEVPQAAFKITDTLSETERGEGGYASTGFRG